MKKVLIVGGMGMAEQLLATVLMSNMKLSACDVKEMSMEEVDEIMRRENEQRVFKIERTYIPEPEFDYSLIKKHELHKLHPFAKFVGTKKNW